MVLYFNWIQLDDMECAVRWSLGRGWRSLVSTYRWIVTKEWVVLFLGTLMGVVTLVCAMESRSHDNLVEGPENHYNLMMSERSFQSLSAHQSCMMALLRPVDGLTAGEEMGLKTEGLLEGVNMDTLTDITLEAFHVLCFRIFGEPDLRDENNEMPWVKPTEPLCYH